MPTLDEVISIKYPPQEKTATTPAQAKPPQEKPASKPAQEKPVEVSFPESEDEAPSMVVPPIHTESLVVGIEPLSSDSEDEETVLSPSYLTNFSDRVGLSPRGTAVATMLDSLAQSDNGIGLIKSQIIRQYTNPKGEQAILVSLRDGAVEFVPQQGNKMEMRFSLLGNANRTIKTIGSTHLPFLLDVALTELAKARSIPNDASALKEAFRLGGYRLNNEGDAMEKAAQLLPKSAGVFFDDGNGNIGRVIGFERGGNSQPENITFSLNDKSKTLRVREFDKEYGVTTGKNFSTLK